MPKFSRPLVWAENGWVKCKVPYDPDITPIFVQELKDSIDWRLRQWSSSEKLWMIDPSQWSEIVRVARKYFKNVDVNEQESKEKDKEGSKSSFNENPYTTIANMLRVSSAETLSKVYRILVADLHPDKGGDVETMKRLNIAWDKIKPGTR